MINIATIVVTIKPISTGLTFFLASSKASTPQIAAIPPPKAAEKILETEPTKDMPESIRVLLIAAMMDIMNIVGISSFVA